jgi:hypothetical protein
MLLGNMMSKPRATSSLYITVIETLPGSYSYTLWHTFMGKKVVLSGGQGFSSYKYAKNAGTRAKLRYQNKP